MAVELYAFTCGFLTLPRAFLLKGEFDSIRERIAFLRDHPLSSDRLTRIAQRSGDATGAPLLSGADWTALKAICR